MWKTQIRDEESKIETENNIKYKGTARIRLKWLYFQWNQPKKLDNKNVERLKADFRKDCRRFEESNHISTVINQLFLDAAEERSGVSARQLSHFILRKSFYKIFLRTHQALTVLSAYSIWRYLPSNSFFPRIYIYIFVGLFVFTSIVQCVNVL